MCVYMLFQRIVLIECTTAQVTTERRPLVRVHVIGEYGRLTEAGRTQFALVWPATEKQNKIAIFLMHPERVMSVMYCWL